METEIPTTEALLKTEIASTASLETEQPMSTDSGVVSTLEKTSTTEVPTTTGRKVTQNDNDVSKTEATATSGSNALAGPPVAKDSSDNRISNRVNATAGPVITQTSGPVVCNGITCDQNAFCKKLESDNSCACLEGYIGNGTHCKGKTFS